MSAQLDESVTNDLRLNSYIIYSAAVIRLQSCKTHTHTHTKKNTDKRKRAESEKKKQMCLSEKCSEELGR